MNRRYALLVILVGLLVVAGVASAAANGFSLDSWTVDGGGGTSTGGDYTVSATIGQPDAGQVMNGGDYSVVGGFWSGAMAPPSPILVYFPLVIR